MGEAWRTAQPFRIVPRQRGDNHQGFRPYAPMFVQMSIHVRQQRQQTRFTAAGRRSILGRAVLLAGPRRVFMVQRCFGRSIADHERWCGVSDGMIVGGGKCALGCRGMGHEHRRCQNCDCTRKLLPDRRSSRSGGRPPHGEGTPTTEACSSVCCPGRLPAGWAGLSFRLPAAPSQAHTPAPKP